MKAFTKEEQQAITKYISVYGIQKYLIKRNKRLEKYSRKKIWTWDDTSNRRYRSERIKPR